MEFVDAEFIPSAGGTGRKREPNPYTDVIAAIALKTNDAGKPVAKGFPIDDNADTAKIVARAKRQLAEAGKTNKVPVTVIGKTGPLKDKNGKVVAGKLLFSFWTVNPQKRPRKAKVAEATPAAAK